MSWYDTKQSDDESPELWGMQSTSSLPLLHGPPLPGVVTSNRVLFMGQTELNSADAKLNCLKKNCFGI